ncbi:mitochondrial zinc maintenance protein 1, mitochondrial [Phaeosphaeriaceae sp. PMI808]|nr:mitochondrial zinc maintenance protein 1, mitochondrial [Phaeosphaeriaceae sp. PMI808]
MPHELALIAYRNVLRSARIAFKGDTPVLVAARAEARRNFDQNRSLVVGTEAHNAQMTHAGEVAKFLRENVVQGRAAAEGNYKLRIHEHTERGDNEDIKKGGKNSLGDAKCCSA